MESEMTQSTNDVFKLYASKQAKLTVRKLDKDFILIEGDRTALEFLGDLLTTYARSNEHSVQFSPKGAGNARFSKLSTLGVYLHRLPCAQGGAIARRKKTPKVKRRKKILP